jgi:hypothetical protein
MVDYLSDHWVVSILLTVLLGAIGTGLWDSILRPAFAWAGKAIFTILSFNARRSRDKIYKNAAMGHHELPSLYLLMVALVCIFSYVMSVHMKAYSTIYSSSVVETLAGNCLKLDAEKAEQCFQNRLKEKVLPYLQITTLVSIFFSVILLYRFILINRTNLAITYYNQCLKIIRPYINEQKLFEIEQKFSLIETKSDYEALVSQLRSIATENDVALPISYINAL